MIYTIEQILASRKVKPAEPKKEEVVVDVIEDKPEPKKKAKKDKK